MKMHILSTFAQALRPCQPPRTDLCHVAVARVDLDHPLNDISAHPTSSYRPVEQHLAHLEALCGLPPLCLNDFKDTYQARDNYAQDTARIEALSAENSKKRLKTEESGKDAQSKEKGTKTYWARGTGYGHGKAGAGDPVWDARASEAMQRARDAELKKVVEQLAVAVALELADPSSECDADGDNRMVPSTSAAAQNGGLEPDPAWCSAALKASCLLPFLMRELKNTAFTDMCSRAPYYCALLELINRLCHPATAHMLWMQQDGATIAKVIPDMAVAAQQYSRMSKLIYDADLQEQQQQAAASSSTGRPSAKATAASEALKEMEASLQLATLILDATSKLQTLRQQQQQHEAGPSAPAAQDYCSALRPLQVEYLSDLKDCTHAYTSQANSEAVHPKARMVRLAKEISGLSQLLPLTESSSVFVRIDEEKVMLWRALITGPEDTPYSCGCFIFDIFFPSNYPSSPPQVLLKTTGGNTVRFNPNLYANGKVCLSLLGTWEGGKGEGWNPSVSTALQVLLSIQSLILVPEPYFNEPGYERSMGTDQGNQQSRGYNKEIREQTIRLAMLDILRHPPREFEAVIKMHFKMRREYLLKTIQIWTEQAQTWNSSHARTLTQYRDQLQPLLAAL